MMACIIPPSLIEAKNKPSVFIGMGVKMVQTRENM
jgi:hypothetical protein